MNAACVMNSTAPLLSLLALECWMIACTTRLALPPWIALTEIDPDYKEKSQEKKNKAQEEKHEVQEEQRQVLEELPQY